MKFAGTARGYDTFRIPRHVTWSLRVPWTVAGHSGIRFCPQSATATKTEAHDTTASASGHSDPEPVAVLCSGWTLHVCCHVEDTPGALTQPSLVSTTAKSVVAHLHQSLRLFNRVWDAFIHAADLFMQLECCILQSSFIWTVYKWMA
jgi:hypothetical protein